MSKRNAVLVVEDEPFILMDALDLVEEAGWVGYGARNAVEALVEMEKRDDVAVLFTDVQMEGSMDGMDLARAVAVRWPEVRIVVTSGHVRPTEGDLPAAGVFIAKPYAPKVVVSTLGDMIGRSAA